MKANEYIFFLQLGTKLTKTYLQFSTIMSNWGITVLPISLEDLKHVSFDMKQFVVVLNFNLETKSNFDKFKKKYLDFVLQTYKIHLVDISSYSAISNAVKLEQKNCYSHYHLPVDIHKVSKDIAYQYYKERERIHKWPGGSRATLPEAS